MTDRSHALRLTFAVMTLGCLACPLTANDFPTVLNSPSEDQFLPLPALEAAATMKLPKGFHATLFAAEPEVQNPIGMAWDQQGRMWVAENYTYSDRTQHFDLSLRDRVLIFEDLDQDGHADSRKVFVDNVQMLTSVEVGRGGVWLLCPPQLLFVPDANADAVPDGPAQVVLDGFDVAQDNYHNFANGLRWGPDGWLYGRCGHSCPGRLGVPGTPEAERVPIDGGIWRFHPQQKTVEVLCHGTVNPWGHDWNQHGELFFINTVIGHLWHCVPGSHFKESFGESMNADVYERMDMIADHYHFDVTGNWSAGRDGKANDFGGGHAHIGMLIYQNGHWPDAYQDRLMTLNMHGRRINVEELQRTGSGYVGKHAPDFMLSQDPFFRGLELSVGPDGNLFVLDWSDTGECHEQTGVHRKSGRIFKISYDAELQQSATAKVFKPACLAGEGPLPQLWTAYQAGTLTTEQLRELTGDPNEHVRAWAIRLLTDHWPLDWITGLAPHAVYPAEPETWAVLHEMARTETSGLVLRVLASTLQRLPLEQRARVATEIVKHAHYADDHDLSLLVWYGLISVGKTNPEALIGIAQTCQWPDLIYSISRFMAGHMRFTPQALDQLLAATPQFSETAQANVLLGMQAAVKGWRKTNKPTHWDEFSKLRGVRQHPEELRDLGSLFGDGRALAEVRQIALDNKTDLRTRQKALQTLIDSRPDDLRQLCELLLDVRLLNATALKGLVLTDDPALAQLLSRKYRRFQPDDRKLVIDALLSRPKWAAIMLDDIAQRKSQINVSDITASQARQIQSLGEEFINQKLSQVWGELRDTSAERRELIGSLKAQLTQESLQEAILANGRFLFTKTCSQCHVLYGEGQKVGPDLTGAQRANLDYLLENILDPSAVVSKDFRMSLVMTADGRVLNGLVVSQDDQRLILRTATELVTLNRNDVEQVQSSTLSAMPDGLLQNLSTDQIRDLIAYLMHPVQIPLLQEFTPQ